MVTVLFTGADPHASAKTSAKMAHVPNTRWLDLQTRENILAVTNKLRAK
jgi:hypothetical protein